MSRRAAAARSARVAGSRAPDRWRTPWRHPWVRHLRLPFNVLLSPLYFWGAWWAAAGAPGALDPWRLAVGWVALHVFLYGGTSALNSYYDRDEGPIGGLAEPPPVDRGLLAWSWWVQLAGAPLALWVGGPFLVVWIALLLVATAYSHPATRWKASPAAALAAVGLGQGGLGAIAGAWAVRSSWPEAWALLGTPSAAAYLAVAALLVLALYVVSQAYQVEEDRRRGDRTLPVLLGARRALRVASLVAALGGAALAGLVALRAGSAWGLAVAAFLAALGAWQWRWSTRFDARDVLGSFRTAMRFVAVAGVGLSALLVALLVWAPG